MDICLSRPSRYPDFYRFLRLMVILTIFRDKSRVCAMSATFRDITSLRNAKIDDSLFVVIDESFYPGPVSRDTQNCLLPVSLQYWKWTNRHRS